MPSLIPNLYIIGTSEYGVSNVPMLISNEEDFVSIYGTCGTLIDAYRKISSITDVPNIYAYKCNGRHSNVYANIICENKVVFNGIEFKSVYSSDIYDGILILFTDLFLQIVYNTRVLQYDFYKYNTIHKLFKAINNDCESGSCPVSVINYTLEQNSHPSESFVSCNKPILITSNGDNGLNCSKKEVFSNMKDATRKLAGLNIDCIVFADCFIDDALIKDEETSIFSVDENLNFFDLMLSFCNRQLKYNIITKGIIGFNPLRANINYSGIVKELLIESNNKVIAPSNEKYESRKLSLITVTFGDIYYDFNRMIDNHYLAYAAVICSEEYSNNITNIDYGERAEINYVLDLDILDILKTFKFVFLRKSPLTDKVHIVNANNLSKEIFSCEYVIRSLQMCYKMFDYVFDDILGEDVNNNTEQKFNSLISETLNELCQNTAIEKYSYTYETIDDHTYVEVMLYFPNFVNPIKYFLTK